MDNKEKLTRDQLANILKISFHSIVTEAEDWRPVADYIFDLLELQQRNGSTLIGKKK